jgi:pimeloyl-ACP methyl ester carboxylesterase
MHSHKTTIVTVPCFSGAPWEVETLSGVADWPIRTMRLPDDLDDIEHYADFVQDQVADLSDYVLVGDSFGAVVSVAAAVRNPSGLAALVLSGGFASNPLTSPVARTKMKAARYLPGPLYRHVVLRLHAAALASPYDAEAERPLTPEGIRKLFLANTPWRSYVGRSHAALLADYASRLDRIRVPTLILTPAHDTLIGERPTAVLRQGIPDAVERVLPGTGHMFRFTHPRRYSSEMGQFLDARLPRAGVEQ